MTQASTFFQTNVWRWESHSEDFGEGKPLKEVLKNIEDAPPAIQEHVATLTKIRAQTMAALAKMRAEGASEEAIKDAKRKGKDREKQYKGQLPAYAFSTAKTQKGRNPNGKPTERGNKNTTAHTGLLCIDVDGLESPDAAADMRGKLVSEHGAFAAFLSPSQHGVKALLRLEPVPKPTAWFDPTTNASLDPTTASQLPEGDQRPTFECPLHEWREHEAAFEAAQSYFRKHGIEIDRACRDVSRMCYTSHDPYMAVNPDASPFLWQEVGNEDAANEKHGELFEARLAELQGLNPELLTRASWRQKSLELKADRLRAAWNENLEEAAKQGQNDTVGGFHLLEQAAEDAAELAKIAHWTPPSEAVPKPLSEIPDRRWLWFEWLPVGCVTLLYGEGGTGKTKLALQLAAQHASGYKGDWFYAQENDPCASEIQNPNDRYGRAAPILFCTWEDEPEEVSRRLGWSEKALGWGGARRLSKHLTILDLQASGPAWGPEHGKHVSTRAGLLESGEAIQEEGKRRRAQLIILDNVAAAFASNENDRGAVREFVNTWHVWAREQQCGVLMLGHPPKSGDLYSGSTDWRNAARCLWVLQKHKVAAKEGTTKQVETGLWVLNKEKSNYSMPETLHLKREEDYGVWQKASEGEVQQAIEEAQQAKSDGKSKSNGKTKTPPKGTSKNV